MSTFNLMKERYSTRSYKPDAVEEDKLRIILEAGILAPTAANRQALQILVIKTEGRKEELRRIYGREWFVEAPLILGVCAVPDKSWVRRDGRNYSDVDAAIVMDHMILAAAEQGLGTCWIAAFDAPAAKEVLQLEDHLDLVVLTPLGYAKDTPQPKARKSLEDLVVYM